MKLEPPTVDPFSQKRLVRFIQDFRKQSGQLPTLKDFESIGFDAKQIDAAVRLRLIELFYSTLTNGTIVKTYKVSQTQTP